jgi:hypothetical protein
MLACGVLKTRRAKAPQSAAQDKPGTEGSSHLHKRSFAGALWGAGNLMVETGFSAIWYLSDANTPKRFSQCFLLSTRAAVLCEIRVNG